MYISINNQFGRRIIGINDIRSIEIEPAFDDDNKQKQDDRGIDLFRLVVYGNATYIVDGEYAFDSWTIAEGPKSDMLTALERLEHFMGRNRRSIVDGQVWLIADSAQGSN